MYPHTIVYEICGNTLIDKDDFLWLSQYRWLRSWDSSIQSYCVERWERISKSKVLHIRMAREILGLPRASGHNPRDKADHINHDTLDHTRSNLRVVTSSQSGANRRAKNVGCRFKGVSLRDNKFSAKISYNHKFVYFPRMRIEIEAGLMFFYAASIFYGDFCYVDPFPENEMPSQERQDELYAMVVTKLTEVGLLQ